MINREIPFRPRLEGEFRVRFYNAASEITEKTPTLTIARIAEREIEWVEKDCQYNIEQRKKYRAVWFLFRDLIRASWKACYRNGVIYMSLPTLNGTDMHDTTSPEVKALLRSWMSESRHERLVGYTDFINRMENPGTNKQSIAALIADGDELEKRIKRVHTGEIAIEAAVQPYLQLVRENDRDVFTGLKTSEIWRYFRLTWSTPVETTPGRTMQYLIRDAAHPMHAVMGIASLENCAVQITCRDDYIGWNQKAFIERIVTVDNDRAKEEFKQLLVYLEDGIDGIDYSELCTAMVVKNPTDTDIQLLLDEASNAEQNRQQLLRNEVEGDVDDIEKSELGSISIDAERALYRRKRAEQLARLLSAKKAIRDLINAENFNEIWIDFCKSETGNSAIRGALVAQKTKHIGSSMMELNVCGAIPPYNEILGGKLVALLATSPQVIHDYKERYADKASEIASRLKGMPVCRPADLVYVGTTSLYYVGSSQYNRLKMPGSIFNTDFDIVWKKLGMTIGFGTMHISKATTMSLTEATSDGFNRINHVFGEGASPKMRLLTMSIRELLESTNEDSKDFSKHAMSRIVYGACLAENTFDYLLGKESKPKYYTDMADYVSGTQKIIDFWRNRWLKSRLNYEPIYRRIRDFDKQGFLVSNQIDEDEEWSFSKLEEVPHMPTNDETKTGLQFVRDFYRGSSAYLYDLNLFAQRLASLTEEQKKGMDALLKIKQNHRVAPIPLNQLINLTYNTDICCFAPRVSNHEELGAFLYANEMLSNEAMALLDTTEEGSGFRERLLELLGEQHQEDHGGVFTDFGYAELGGEIKDIYVCQSNETACFHRSDAPVVLEVRKGFFNDPSYDNDKTAVLNLPAADAGIWRAVEKVDAASVDECAFRCVDCLIPFLRDAINNAIDDEDGIEQADEFAKRLAQIEREWPESDMVKYKALLSVVDHPSLQDATRLMGEIDQYELRPEVAQTWGYAEMMFREKYSALPEELFQTPQAAQIGQKMLDDRLGVITEYGLIRRKDGQPLPVFQPEQEIGQGLEMM